MKVSTTLQTVFVLLVLAILGNTLLDIKYGSVANGLRYLRGEELFLSPNETDLGLGRPGEFTIKVAITNLSKRHVRVIGARGACSCITVADRPSELESRGSGQITLLVKLDDELLKAVKVQEFVVFTDLAGHRQLRGRVVWQ